VLSNDQVLIDICTLINLLASDEPKLLSGGLSSICMVCEPVSRESLFLRAEQENVPPQRIALDPLFASGGLHACQAESADEEALYVSLAAELDDGEAMSLAISSVRGYGLATDDRKVRHFANEIASVPLSARLRFCTQLVTTIPQESAKSFGESNLALATYHIKEPP